MSTTHKKILEYKPFKKETYRSVCHCYDSKGTFEDLEREEDNEDD